MGDMMSNTMKHTGSGTRFWTLLLVVGATSAGCNPMDDALVAIFGRSMREQPAIQPYQDPRTPPEGAVSFASGNFPAAPGQVAVGQAEGTPVPPPVTPFQLLTGDPAASDLPNPIAPGAVSLARGEVMFNRSCVPCHGVTGAGDGLVTQAGVPVRSLLTPEARILSDGYIYSLIRVGRGAMPSYAHQVTHYDRWHVVNYVRQLQSAAIPGEPAGQQEN